MAAELESWRDIVVGCLPALGYLALLTPIGFAVLWIFVIVPGRSQRFLQSLERRGYSRVPSGDSALAGALARLMPLTPTGRRHEGKPDEAPHPTHAVVRRSEAATRFVVRVRRIQSEKRGVRRKNVIRWFMVVLESRPLPLGDDTHIVDKKAFSDSTGLSNLPAALQAALAALPKRDAVSSVRVGPAGWGTCCEIATGTKELEQLLEIGEAISSALDTHSTRRPT
jgi:hypothetical protein